jgi:Ca2+-binding EF-hand superfamily protein
MSQTLTNDEIEYIKQIFNQFDKNNNGSIDKKELNTLSIALNKPLSPADLHDFMRAVDKDNSGNISWEEFIKYWGSES